MQKTFVLIILSLLLMAGCKDKEITNFEECAKAGYEIMESYPRQCRAPDGEMFVEITPPTEPEPIGPDTEVYGEECAKNGGLLREPDEYCCEGLKEWPIPDHRLSIADVCYEVGQPSKILMEMCIKCGDGVCGKHLMYDENPCNCPEDCKGKNKSMFQSIEEFCQSNDWKMSLSKACEETIKDSPICELCLH